MTVSGNRRSSAGLIAPTRKKGLRFSLTPLSVYAGEESEHITVSQVYRSADYLRCPYAKTLRANFHVEPYL